MPHDEKQSGAGREGYRDALQWTVEHLPCRSDADREWTFGKPALSLCTFAHYAPGNRTFGAIGLSQAGTKPATFGSTSVAKRRVDRSQPACC